MEIGADRVSTALTSSSTATLRRYQSAVHTVSQSAVPPILSLQFIPILSLQLQRRYLQNPDELFQSLSPNTITILMGHSAAQTKYNSS